MLPNSNYGNTRPPVGMQVQLSTAKPATMVTIAEARVLMQNRILADEHFYVSFILKFDNQVFILTHAGFLPLPTGVLVDQALAANKASLHYSNVMADVIQAARHFVVSRYQGVRPPAYFTIDQIASVTGQYLNKETYTTREHLIEEKPEMTEVANAIPHPSKFNAVPQTTESIVDSWIARVLEGFQAKTSTELENLVYGKGIAMVFKYDSDKTPITGTILAGVSGILRKAGWHLNVSHSGADTTTFAMYPIFN